MAQHAGTIGRDPAPGDPSYEPPQERSVVEEKLHWTRLELQRTLALSADADETIYKLATAARRMMQERDEARSQGMMLMAELQARNAQTPMLPSRIAVPDVSVAVAGCYSSLAPLGPFGGTTATTTTTMQEQYGMQAGAPSSSYCLASSSSSYGGIVGPAEPWSLHDLASSSQDPFDPDMFLVDSAAEEAPAVTLPLPQNDTGDLADVVNSAVSRARSSNAS